MTTRIDNFWYAKCAYPSLSWSFRERSCAFRTKTRSTTSKTSMSSWPSARGLVSLHHIRNVLFFFFFPVREIARVSAPRGRAFFEEEMFKREEKKWNAPETKNSRMLRRLRDFESSARGSTVTHKRILLPSSPRNLIHLFLRITQKTCVSFWLHYDDEQSRGPRDATTLSFRTFVRS